MIIAIADLRRLAVAVSFALISVAWTGAPALAAESGKIAAPAFFLHRPPDSRIPGFPDVIGEFIEIPGAAAPGTPSPLNEATFLRVRSQIGGDNPGPVDAVVVAQPGFASAAGLWLNTAAAIVHNAALQQCRGAPCQIEVWVVQRRSNLVTDTQGLFLGRSENDPRVMLDYYFGPSILSSDPTRPGKFPLAVAETVLGRPDAVFRELQQQDLPFEADWGYETFSGDVTAMISLIKEVNGAKNIFLAGHSQGGLFTSVYAGTLLPSGQRGQDLLAGLIYLDGGPTPTPAAPSAAAINSYLAEVDSLRAGTSNVYGAPFGNNILFGNVVLGPGNGAQNAVFGAFARQAPQNESIFGLQSIGGGSFSPAGDAFQENLRVTNQAYAGLTFGHDPIPGALIQTPIIAALGTNMGRLNFTPAPAATLCDPLDPLHRMVPPCPPAADQIGADDSIAPDGLRGWLDGGGLGPDPQPSTAEAFIDLLGYAPSRTNVVPSVVTYPISGPRVIYGGEMTGTFWYQSVRYDDDMALLAGSSQIAIDQDGVSIDVDKTLIDIPIFAAKGPLTPALGNPFPLVSDYTEINPKGIIQSAVASGLTPVDPQINSARYNHSDFPAADDSLAGRVLPGQPGGNIVADLVVSWILARAHGQASVPSPAVLGVMTTR